MTNELQLWRIMKRRAFFMQQKRQGDLSQWGEWVCGYQPWKERRLLCESIFVPINKWTLTLKNNEKRSFCYETKASMSFIPMREMSLCCTMMKGKEITMWICVYPDWQMNFNSKKWWKEKLFLWNHSINIIYPNEWNEFMVTNHE